MNLESILFFNTRRHRQKRTMPHPDLSIPLLPDAEHDLPLPHPRPHPQYTWPEAGPSSPSGTSSVSSVEQPRRADGGDERMHMDTDVSKAGIFGAKAIAAMTGAMATSLLSTSCVFPPCLHISIGADRHVRFSDTVRRSQDSASNRPASFTPIFRACLGPYTPFFYSYRYKQSRLLPNNIGHEYKTPTSSRLHPLFIHLYPASSKSQCKSQCKSQRKSQREAQSPERMFEPL